MDHINIANQLARNQKVFGSLLKGIPKEEYVWKPSPKKWCLLEVICHLYDEEREDFRARAVHSLENPETPFVSINPTAWVHERQYMDQNFESMLDQFLLERDNSVKWLQSLSSPNWDSYSIHPALGKISAKKFLYNWLAHDYHHIRQINNLKYDYLQFISNEDLSYAGNW